jgi:hypothetical protein
MPERDLQQTAVSARAKTSPEKLLSCADWLYPLSSRSGYWFIREDGSETEDTGPDSFIQSIYREAEDSWTLATNYRRVDKGDRVWPYYGIWDGDLGIVGLANVLRVEDPPTKDGLFRVILKWDVAVTHKLFADPFPAAKVRRFVRPIKAVHALTPHSGLIRQLHQHAGLTARSQPTLEEMKTMDWRELNVYARLIGVKLSTKKRSELVAAVQEKREG